MSIKEADEKGMTEVQGKIRINELFLKWARILAKPVCFMYHRFYVKLFLRLLNNELFQLYMMFLLLPAAAGIVVVKTSETV